MKIHSLQSEKISPSVLQCTPKRKLQTNFVVQNITANKNAAKILASYNAVNIHKKISFGRNFKVIKKADELMLHVSDIVQKASKVRIQAEATTQRGNKNSNLLLSSSRRIQDGIFEVPLLAIDRKTNEYLKSVETKKIYFFDNKGKLIQTDSTMMSVSPIKEFEENLLKEISINGEKTLQDYNVISEGSTEGILTLFDRYTDIKQYGRKKTETKPVIAILNTPDAVSDFLTDSAGENFKLPTKVVAVLMGKKEGVQNFFLGCLSHAKSRMDGRHAFVVAGYKVINRLKELYINTGKNIVKLDAKQTNIDIHNIPSLSETNQKTSITPIKMVTGLLTPPKFNVMQPKAKINRLSSSDKNFVPEAVGVKAYNLGKLKAISNKIGIDVPNFFTIPAGEIDRILKYNKKLFGQKGNLTKLIERANDAYYAEEDTEMILNNARDLICKELKFPLLFKGRINSFIRKTFNANLPKIYDGKQNSLTLSVRPSVNNTEDNAQIFTKDMFSSYIGVRDQRELQKSIKQVIASLFSDKAYRTRMKHSIPHSAVRPSIIIQNCEKGFDYTGTMSTNKIGKDGNVSITLSQGDSTVMQGEPYNFEYNRLTGEGKRISLATKVRKKCAECINPNDFTNSRYSLTDYSHDPLNLTQEKYSPFIKEIAQKGLAIEEAFDNKPQDIEFGVKFIRDIKGKITDLKLTVWKTIPERMTESK